MWDPKTGKFEHVAKSLSKRDSQGQAVVGGEIFVVGGYDNISRRGGEILAGDQQVVAAAKHKQIVHCTVHSTFICIY